MAKALNKDRPQSTIADMIDGSLIEQATEEVISPAQIDEKTKIHNTTAMSPIAEPGVKASPQRTGEHSDIQKMYRLTPTALRTIQELSISLNSNLGFEVNNSAVIRSILRVIHQALPKICQDADERLTPRRQPSTAIGNERARDELESIIAAAILSGICRHANS